MDHAGPEIPVDSDVALCMVKRKCWSQLSTGAYGRKAVFRLSREIGTIQEKFDFLGPKVNFFLLTVCS